MTTNYIDKKNDMVLYRGDNGEVKSMGYTINSVLPHLNIPAMKGGGKITKIEPGTGKQGAKQVA